MPDETARALGLFLDVVKIRKADTPRAMQTVIRDILDDPYGVVIFNDRVEINLRPGAVLVEESKKFAEIEKNWAVLDSNQ